MYNVVIFTDITDNIVSMPNLGPYKCAHVLRKSGYSCLVVNHLSSYSYEDLTELIDVAVSDVTFLIGFSSTFLKDVQIEKDPTKPTLSYKEIGMNTVFPQGKEFEDRVVAYLKSKNTKIKLVAGGAKVTPQYFNRNIDYVCVGYSEISVVNLADHLTKNIELNNSFKNIMGVTIVDDRLAKSYDFPNEDMIWEDIDVVNHKALPIEIGRGCIFRCKFCSFPLMGKKTLDFVKHPDILQRELEHNYEQYGITNYMLGDDTFNDHPEKLNSILSVVKKLKFQPIFWGYHRLDLLCTRPETVQILYDIGVRAMYFGIESLHPAAAKAIGKGHDRTKQIKMVEKIRSKYDDLTLHGSFIVGLPGEDVASVTQTYNYLMDQTMPLNSWRFHGLLIATPDGASFESEFTANYPKYGYENQGIIDSIWINWKNEFMDASKARELANQFNYESRLNDAFALEGNLCMPLTTMGYDFNKLRTTKWKEFDFNNVEYNVKPKFIEEYKKKLIDIIKERL